MDKGRINICGGLFTGELNDYKESGIYKTYVNYLQDAMEGTHKFY